MTSAMMIDLIKRLLGVVDKATPEADPMRWERLEHYLDCCRNINHMAGFDQITNATLKKDDYFTERFFTLWCRRYDKLISMAATKKEIVNYKQGLGEFILLFTTNKEKK